MYHRRMNGIRTTYAGDARRQQQEYRLHKYVFRNARVHRLHRQLDDTNPVAVFILDASVPLKVRSDCVDTVPDIKSHAVAAAIALRKVVEVKPPPLVAVLGPRLFSL